MNNDYCLQSYTNIDQGEGDGAKAGAIATTKAGAANWFQKTRIYKKNHKSYVYCMFNYINRYYCCNILELYLP